MKRKGRGLCPNSTPGPVLQPLNKGKIRYWFQRFKQFFMYTEHKFWEFEYDDIFECVSQASRNISKHLRRVESLDAASAEVHPPLAPVSLYPDSVFAKDIMKFVDPTARGSTEKQ